VRVSRRRQCNRLGILIRARLSALNCQPHVSPARDISSTYKNGHRTDYGSFDYRTASGGDIFPAEMSSGGIRARRSDVAQIEISISY